VVESVVGVAAAEPAAHRQSVSAAVVVAEPAAFTVERAVIEVSEQVKPPQPT
jgi:hypothetical protein